jgi:tRNA G18 (ribose-2'-O)-methylase SpoU
MKKLTHSEIAGKRIPLEAIQNVTRIPLIVIVDNVRSLYNVGSIFRTSDGAMIEKLILTGFTPYPPRKEIEKTALGSTKSVPWEYTKHPAETIQKLQRRGYKICCLELTDKSIPYYDITGVSKEVIEMCESAIEIPMFGIKQSLNVAVAYGIAVFELVRIWREGR